ncbi:D-alanyl-D-alanine carboxypeptidase [Bacteriovorax sp. PP10]|uniref:D-alanyl-D-alanine carboxypeptidase n=1 Tax=Bacteriovorax antarcticus TaxID=3088717 RepID=A0ABU5VT90_9BACT|nr:D-alanyl-D-alanine carboxypeptidase [Bacteriovorax sp. PP10]MEA9356142.1 D-alanyl-D-alanine carboxypeptidase [Bacteriovorax sp. PP10]
MTLTKKITTAALLAMSTTSAFASVKTDASFDKLLKTYKVAPTTEQSYCYTDEKGVLQGKNVDLQIRLASVSKLLTSLWAVEQKGVNYRYDTKLFIKGNNLHLQGSFDPFMSNEKMLFLVSQLNTLGYKHFDKITYDKNIQINPNAQVHTDEYPLITRDSNGKNIKTYFNTASWSKVFRAEYDRLASLAKKDRFVKDVNFSVDTVEYVDSNPLAGDDVKVLTLTSPELYKYLKETNVKSNNYSAHTIFRDLGGAEGFEKFLADRFSLTADQIKLYNGSGLPSTIDGKRVDNYASCAIMANLISELKASAERQQKELEDVVAVPGNDQGTFRNRLNSADLKNTFVAKTGTLMHTSTLAGAMSTQKGFSFFGVFNQTTDINGAKAVQNEMVKVLLTEMGGPKVFGYQVEGFHAYDNDENVKNFDLDHAEDDFTAIEGNLH